MKRTPSWACFDLPDALAINRARMDHLASLDLPLTRRRVLDAGCGVGHLSGFFVSRECRVVCLDGRPENLRELESRHPGLETHLANLDSDSLAPLGRFDVVFCYGLLYHLEDPARALSRLAEVCDDLLLLETIITDRIDPVSGTIEEPSAPDQALRRKGCRPSPPFVIRTLRDAGFPFIYMPVSPPAHPDFRFECLNDSLSARGGRNLRHVFVASRRNVPNPRLTRVEA